MCTSKVGVPQKQGTQKKGILKFDSSTYVCLQFISFKKCYGVALFAIIDVLRIWFGPFPSWICTFGVMVKNQSFISIVLAFTSVTILKFTFLCLLRRIPQMDDDFVAKSIIRTIWFVSVSIVCSKFWYEKPNMQQVRKIF